MHIFDRDNTEYTLNSLIYRPHSSGVESNEKLHEIIPIADGNTVLIGDLNAPGVDWKNPL
jgi:hypothetical protein